MNEDHYKSKAEYLDKRELELLAKIKELEKQLAFMEGEYPEPTIVQKMQEFANLEQALNRIVELEKSNIDLAFRAVYAEQALKIVDKEAFKLGFRAGFMSSGEGYNGEITDEACYEADLKEAWEEFIK